MTSSPELYQVAGTYFVVWADYIKRGCFARNEDTGEIKQISGGGYISRDLTVRKEIALRFGLPTFRKNAPKTA